MARWTLLRIVGTRGVVHFEYAFEVDVLLRLDEVLATVEVTLRVSGLLERCATSACFVVRKALEAHLLDVWVNGHLWTDSEFARLLFASLQVRPSVVLDLSSLPSDP